MEKEHIGYMNKVFRTKQEASGYYIQHNPHMRRISSESSWKSDWDPQTKLLYVVRQYTCEYLKIPPFS
jgi:hypothetical protein